MTRLLTTFETSADLSILYFILNKPSRLSTQKKYFLKSSGVRRQPEYICPRLMVCGL